MKLRQGVFLLKWAVRILFMALFPCTVGAQKVLSENLSPKVKLYWDGQKKHLSSSGSYYQSEIVPESTEKHGKWLFYNKDGQLEEERNFYRDRLHGKQITYYPETKKIKEVYFAKFNIPDSTFKQYNAQGTLTIEGNYVLGSPSGTWNYYFEDSTLWKKEFVSNDTTYLWQYFTESIPHQETVKMGNGQVVSYYKTGGIKESYTFKNGLREGAFYENLASGKTSIQGEFLKGKKNGLWQYFFASGQVEMIQHFNVDSLDGVYEVYYADGSPKTLGSYQNNKKQGEWIWYMPKQQLEMKGSFENNKQHGRWEYYFSSGELSYIAYFDNDKKTGTWNYFYKNGNKFKTGNYINDQKEGRWQTWYEDGTLLMNGLYEKGKEEGEWMNYWGNGHPKNKAFYRKGKLTGAWYSWSEEGVLTLFGRYKKDLKTGNWTSYYPNGRKKEEITYRIKNLKNTHGEVVALGLEGVQSVKHGETYTFSERDNLVTQKGRYKNDQKHGTWINYHPGGFVPAVISTYKNGKLDGEFSQYSRSGNKLNEIHYRKGLKDGLFVVYGENGKPVSTKMFKKGIQLKQVMGGEGFTPE